MILRYSDMSVSRWAFPDSLPFRSLGLRRLGEVGVEVQVGCISRYIRSGKISRCSNRIIDTVRYTGRFTGGFYLEAGIYLEVNLVAESKVFRLRLEAPLIPEIKWPLFSMGDKNLVICLNDVTTPILFSSNGTYWGEVNINSLPRRVRTDT